MGQTAIQAALLRDLAITLLAVPEATLAPKAMKGTKAGAAATRDLGTFGVFAFQTGRPLMVAAIQAQAQGALLATPVAIVLAVEVEEVQGFAIPGPRALIRVLAVLEVIRAVAMAELVQ
jgi:hypothetical protein